MTPMWNKRVISLGYFLTKHTSVTFQTVSNDKSLKKSIQPTEEFRGDEFRQRFDKKIFTSPWLKKKVSHCRANGQFKGEDAGIKHSPKDSRKKFRRAADWGFYTGIKFCAVHTFMSYGHEGFYLKIYWFLRGRVVSLCSRFVRPEDGLWGGAQGRRLTGKGLGRAHILAII